MSLLSELLQSDNRTGTAANLAKVANPAPADAADSQDSQDSQGGAGVSEFCARWCEAARAADVLPDSIERMSEAELVQYREHFAACGDWYGAAQTAARMLRDSADMEAGRAPSGWTGAAVCRHCGPVFLAPAVVALLDAVDGHPWCWGCPWCCVTLPKGHRLPRPDAVAA